MPTALINNTRLELSPGEQINCIQAAQRIGFEIPHYCWHPALSVVASCRMCLVEVGGCAVALDDAAEHALEPRATLAARRALAA